MPTRHAKACATSRGVTLIELLIAVTLLSLLSVGILMALRVGLNAMEKANAKLIANRRSASVQRILRSQIAGLMPASADCLLDPSLPPARVSFFQGEPQSMRFVSSYSLEEAARGYPRILEFQVIPGENGRGVRLIVNEMLYAGPRSTGALCVGLVTDPAIGVQLPRYRPIVPGPRSFVLADKLAYCRFAYREAAPAPVFARWLPEWKSFLLPTGVRIDLAPLEPDPSRIPLIGVTVAIRVNKVPNATYTD